MSAENDSLDIETEALSGLVAGAFGGQQPEVEVVEAEIPPPAPGTSPRASLWWYAVLDGRYHFNIAEMALLEEVVQAMTLLDNLRDQFERTGSEYMVRASHGGLQINPLIKEQGAAQTRLATLLKALRIPDADDPSRVANLTSHAARGSLGGKTAAAKRRASTRELMARANKNGG